MLLLDQRILWAIGILKKGKFFINYRLNLNWNEGNHWKSIIKSTEFFEYKLVIFEHNYVKSWENGENRKFDLKSIKEQIESTPTNLDKICIQVSGVNYIFYINTHILDILLEWND